MLKDNCISFRDTERERDIFTTCVRMVLLFWLITVFLSSCAPLEMPSPPPNRTYDLPPERLQEKITTVLQDPDLNLRVISAHEGRIETAYEEYPGEFHGLLWWKKRWQERSRYIITIRAAWRHLRDSELFIRAETEHRPNENYPWRHKESSKKTDDRISQILLILDSKIER